MAVREGLLAMLGERSSHGYQLKTGFEAATGGVWRLNVGQVYTTLDRLVRDGLVTVDEADEQREYRITADGVAELGAWWETVPGDEPPQRDELMLKVLLAISQGREQGLEVVDRQRTAVMALLQTHRQRQRPSGRGEPPSLAQELVEEALVARAEADLRWLDRCEQRLLAAPERSEA
ncbi:MAG TPA: PadR family transcriptional regulator [Acidimicrobiales bacterium]|jgi:DNA-binding PadR family transcriptional regulator|nr:PadR family transcriptional regulator [Acidimicrobiales bacterium]